nr:putative ribonuclease H-like domain-containing protein [Tanacetum cinerariifolium]
AIGFLKPVGCHVMILNTLDNLGKFNTKGDEGYFIGYSMSSKAFRVFNKRTKRVEENLHVDFLENKAIEKSTGPNWLFDIDSLTKSMNYVPVVVTGTNSTNFSGTEEAAGQDVKKDVSFLRYIILSNWFHETHLETSTSNAEDACNADALKSSGNSNLTATSTNPSADHMETLAVETPIPTISSLVPTACLNDSPELSSDTRLISKRVTSQDDTPSLDNILTLTDMLVAQGNTQEEGIDYDEVFAPVARIEAIRLFLAYASFMGFIVYQMDVKSAFLYGTIDEEVYVLQPLGFQDPEFPARVYKVEKAMYGLHQAPRAWYGETWGKDRTGKDVDLHLYRFMIRSLMYLTTSRPDIMFVVCACVGHQVTPKECHLHAFKRIFRYLKGHPKLGLWYPKESLFDLVAYLDSDYGGATQDRKSTTGGCQFFSRRLISLKCKKKTIVATSTTKAEYVAAVSGCGQVLWIQNQLLDYGDCFEKKLISVDHFHTDENVANLLTKPFDAGRFQYLVVEHAMLGFVKGNLIIYTTF